MGIRSVSVVAALLLGLVAGCGAEGERSAPAAKTPEAAALEVLQAWDATRAQAYERGDLGALIQLYEPGSDLAREDRRVLAAYLRRGLVVHGMRTQVLDVAVDHFDAGTLLLRVTDRVTHAWASGSQGGVAVLPVAEPIRRRLAFVKRDERWLLVDAAPAAAYRR
ncbi:MAG: hypothetical protein QM655_09105 [Nocardioidaceae bacterium]